MSAADNNPQTNNIINQQNGNKTSQENNCTRGTAKKTKSYSNDKLENDKTKQAVQILQNLNPNIILQQQKKTTKTKKTKSYSNF